ncbi:ABC transporter ATP-binding protein [Bradyrhizobium icense]|uniref:ABC transporter ATP-binding protein n=1 Tax=Bradyrhizobium icense TaxID=1274631 RepID=A0A1B1UTT2_9BRAD|nr:ABC transporter ATP-binding protein [Bradyrhizobium icense]ANW06182.1 ABC transporter ATP-binding protein [Bradyrhizobium icense]
MIAVRRVTKSFGGLVAVDDCSLDVVRGSITGLIGPNGAGKTTLFNIIAGFSVPEAGEILLEGEPVTGLSPNRLFHKGLVRTFQIPRVFDRMTVIDNLMLVPPAQAGESLLATWLRPGRVVREESENCRKAEEVLAILELPHLRNEYAGNLSGGQKKLLELGRTMMVDPRVALLDEPGAGVNPVLLAKLCNNIARLNRELGYTFCIIEHDMDLVARLCDPIIVLAEGRVLAQGSMDEIRTDPAVLEAYLSRTVSRADAP